MMRRTKIVCTLGPATAAPEQLKDLVATGMDVARLNFSHGTHDDHATMYERVRRAAEDVGRPVGILADLQGPKIRLGAFDEESTKSGVYWATGETVRITVADVDGTHDRVSTTYVRLAQDAVAGDRVLVDDGKVGLVVTAVEGDDVVCEVVEGGPVSNHKGLSVPGMNVSAPALSAKDVTDLEFALRLGVDMIALSFVRDPSDIESVHEVMDAVGRRVPVIAKLEKPEAITDLEPIVSVFDAVMVARGDLGVEVPLEEVPLVQKQVIDTARAQAKPVIVATQMLDSMITNSRPTRAEASDVANAVLDGADAVMLSGETSVGEYPREAVATMDRIARTVESGPRRVPPLQHVPQTQRGVLSYAARDIADRLNATALVAFTESGDTVRRLARLHPRLPLLAFAADSDVRNQLTLSWGTEIFDVTNAVSTDDLIEEVDRQLIRTNRLAKGDTVVVLAGAPPGVSGSTNLITVHRIGEADH
ncbi:pyruvate kinase [Gordonia sp. (in: high G+C Gram-positive bacteria)]|uniref:pyruvate kinase n=1 Tax=Gordonia sp. (in: high G+C Gram-positive bacteria) TaxID=84139 RepID=UPI00259A4111|nr:pyruvate kinase [uncultured Gordonia sp.]